MAVCELRDDMRISEVVNHLFECVGVSVYEYSAVNNTDIFMTSWKHGFKNAIRFFTKQIFIDCHELPTDIQIH